MVSRKQKYEQLGTKKKKEKRKEKVLKSFGILLQLKSENLVLTHIHIASSHDASVWPWYNHWPWRRFLQHTPPMCVCVCLSCYCCVNGMTVFLDVVPVRSCSLVRMRTCCRAMYDTCMNDMTVPSLRAGGTSLEWLKWFILLLRVIDHNHLNS